MVAFAGYAITFASAHILARRRDKLDLVNKHLDELYSQLYVASETGNIAYRSLLARLGKAQSYPRRRFRACVGGNCGCAPSSSIPLNEVREKIIIEKAYLMVEEKMPQCLLDFVTHVVGYKAVLSKWNNGDYTERRSTIGWPPEFDVYVRKSYAALKAEQTRLMHGATDRLLRRLLSKKPSH